MVEITSFVFTTTLLLFHTVDVVVCLKRNRMFRVFDGRGVQQNEYPYVLRLELQVTTSRAGVTSVKQLHLCTSSALTPTVALTASHCYDEEDETNIEDLEEKIIRNYVIRYGLSNVPSKDDKFSKVLSWAIFPRSFDEYMISDDLALITTEPIHLSKYGKLSALDQHTLYGHGVTILGYGLTNHSGGFDDTLNLKMPLQALSAMLWRCEEENALYSHICAGTRCGQRGAVCGGDSGGPVLHSSGIVGITSASAEENCKFRRDDRLHMKEIVFITPISNHLDWIRNIYKETVKYKT